MNSRAEQSRNVPQLRFPEFVGEWEMKKLGEVCNEHQLKNKNKETNEVFSVAKHKGVINQIEHLGRSFSAKEILHYKLIFPGDLVYTKSPTSDFPFGIIKQNRTERIGVVSPLYCVFKPKTFALGYLLHEYFKSAINTYNYLSPLVQKGAKNTMNINNDDFLNGAGLLLPMNEPEQTRIANFLTAVDEKIQALKKKKGLLEAFKKGVMQRLFSQELRFKDENGQAFADWEVKKLGEVAKIYQSKTITQSELTKEGFDVYGANGIIGKYPKYNHELEQIAITCRGNTCGTVNYTNPKSWITGNAMVINVDEKVTVLKKFLFHQLYNSNFGYLISGSGQPQITGNIKEHIVFLPSLPEQTLIANFLSAIDDKIKHTAVQIEKTEGWKKGLLQRMFC